MTLDGRINAIRRDIADVALAGTHFAPHYARGQAMRCAMPSVPLRTAPNDTARAVSELRHGDPFAMIDESRGWAWGYSVDDRYVGYVPTTALSDAAFIPTHVVRARTALVFPEPDIKAPVTISLPMGARIAGEEQGLFVSTAAGFIHQRHLRTINLTSADRQERPADIAENLLGTPYRWGGRSGFGIDCSGLVQLAFDLTGTPVARDSDQQRETIGSLLAEDLVLRRNDLVFFPGHVGIMLDADRIIHANAYAMAVTIEPLAHVVARGSDIIARRRIMP